MRDKRARDEEGQAAQRAAIRMSFGFGFIMASNYLLQV